MQSDIDVALTQPPALLRPPGRERADATPPPDALLAESAAGAGDEERSRADWQEASPPQGDVPTVQTPDGSPTPAVAGPPDDATRASTTAVPQYPPPAAAPGFPGSPGIEPRLGAGGYGEATAAAPPARRPSIGRTLARGLREVAETIILALLIFLLVRAAVQNFQVEGKSMEPTFETGWYLLVNKVLYAEINLKTLNKFIPFIDPGDDPTRYIFRAPKRGDVVVFRAPGRPDSDFIKRIIAVPGERVEVRDCTVFINGQPLDEPYVKERSRYTYGPETVPPDHYFVLGDNRNNSSDSHSWGMVPKENIIGQAWLTYWPFSAFGLVDNTSVEPGADVSEEPAKEAATGKPAPACT